MSIFYDHGGRTVLSFSALGMFVATTTVLTLGVDLPIGLLC